MNDYQGRFLRIWKGINNHPKKKKNGVKILLWLEDLQEERRILARRREVPRLKSLTFPGSNLSLKVGNALNPEDMRVSFLLDKGGFQGVN